MNGRRFFDTNILIYSVSDDDPRGDIARVLLAAGGFVSVQVLNEFAAAARRKLKLPWKQILEALSDFKALCPAASPLTQETHEAAINIAEQYRYSIYDALIIAAALETKCEILYSEDMQGGQVIQGLSIQNPFIP
jgi:predicted nucleic acid-binding protein